MRPIQRDANPIVGDFNDYRDAFPYLASRIGFYCSYCERHIVTDLAIEHIQPEELYPTLIRRWDNFLLACKNCNSTKGYKDVALDKLYFPDRDNTFALFVYNLDGSIEPDKDRLNSEQEKMAENTLALMGLNKPLREVYDENGRLVAIDRVGQRMEIRLIAEESKDDLQKHPTDALRRQIVRTARESGFFSIWMDVFVNDNEMRRRFIEAFPGTAKDCFDVNTQPVSPRPANGLSHAGKV